MIIKGGIVFLRRSDQLPQVTITDARVVMEVEEPATMDDFGLFLSHRIGLGSSVNNCMFITMEKWSQAETRDQLKASSSGKPKGWWWHQIKTQLGIS